MQIALLSRSPSSDIDHGFMESALAAARFAGQRGEVPIGAVVVHEGTIVAVGYNDCIARSDPTAHAEVMALRAAGEQVGNYRLTGTTLYTTVEPCLMCVGAALHARVERIVFGCCEPKVGALGSAYDVGSDQRGNHRLVARGGVCAAEARALLQAFFRMRRGA